jgi:hypothetical protein
MLALESHLQQKEPSLQFMSSALGSWGVWVGTCKATAARVACVLGAGGAVAVGSPRAQALQSPFLTVCMTLVHGYLEPSSDIHDQDGIPHLRLCREREV